MSLDLVQEVEVLVRVENTKRTAVIAREREVDLLPRRLQRKNGPVEIALHAVDRGLPEGRSDFPGVEAVLPALIDLAELSQREKKMIVQSERKKKSDFSKWNDKERCKSPSISSLPSDFDIPFPATSNVAFLSYKRFNSV